MTLGGVLAPVPTPFDEQGRVDPERIERAFVRWVDTSLDGFVVLGTNGEAPLLDEDESDDVIKTARRVVPAGRMLVAGTGRESTRATILATRRAADLGADAVIVRTPGFFKAQMATDAFVRHYTAVAEVSPVPVILYNFTAVTGVTLMPDAVSILASQPNIIGMKESGGDVGRITQLVAAVPPSFCVLAGSAAAFQGALQAGASGGVLALAALLPDACCQLFALTRSGHPEEASLLQERLTPIARLVGSLYGVAGLKAALNLAGYDIGVPRPPLAAVPADAVQAIKDALAAFEEIPA